MPYRLEIGDNAAKRRTLLRLFYRQFQRIFAHADRGRANIHPPFVQSFERIMEPAPFLTDHRIGFTIYKLDQIIRGDFQPVTDALIEHDRQIEGNWTLYSNILERPALKMDRYLNPPLAEPEPSPSQTPAPATKPTASPFADKLRGALDTGK